MIKFLDTTGLTYFWEKVETFLNEKVPITRKINGKALSDDITIGAEDVAYDNTTSGLSATDIKAAIDELATEGSGEVPDGCVYVGDDGEETGELVPVDADTLEGHASDYFATADHTHTEYLAVDGTAAKATADANGNVIADTYASKDDLNGYFPLTGGTVDGNVIASTSEAADRIIKANNSLKGVALYANKTGIGGLWDSTNSKWIVQSSTDGTNTFNGTATNADTLDGHDSEYFAPLENLGGVKLFSALPSGITSDSTMLELIAALPDNSILDVKSVSTPLTPKNYSQLFVFKGNASYFTAIAKSQYDKTISVGGSDTQNGWTGWQTVSTTADLANYLPLTGGNVTGTIEIGDASKATDMNCILKNNVAYRNLQTLADGSFRFYDAQNNKIVFTSSADGATNTFNGTASGNLPLSGGGTVKKANAAPIVLDNTASTTSLTGYSGNSGMLGYLGFNGADNPVYVNNAFNTVKTLHHDGNSAKVAIQSSAPSDTTALWVY